jgi:hypothetical protein
MGLGNPQLNITKHFAAAASRAAAGMTTMQEQYTAVPVQPHDSHDSHENNQGNRLLSASRWLNCFAYCTKALKLIGNVMILFVVGLVLMSWYAVVIVVYGPKLVGHKTLADVLSGVFILPCYTVMVSIYEQICNLVLESPRSCAGCWRQQRGLYSILLLPTSRWRCRLA